MGDISKLDAKLLMAFNALMEERSVTKAARRLNMTQQGLSGTLQRLRELFSDPLFVREARGVTPTPRAERLAPRIKFVLNGLERVLIMPEFDPITAEGTITVSTTDYELTTIMGPLFRKFREEAPNVRLAMHPFSRELMGEQIRKGQVDIALTIPDYAPRNLYSQHLLEEHYLCAVRKDHPIANTQIDIDKFCQYEHLIVSPHKGDFTGPTDVALAKIGRTRRVGLVIPNFSIAGAVLEQTDLISVLPERVLRNVSQNLHIFTPPLEVVGFDLIAVWARRVNDDPLHLWFRSLINEVLGQY